MEAEIKIKKCEVCGSTNLSPVLDLGMHPMCDDLIAVESPAQCKTFPISILYCKQCDTAHQEYQIPKKKLFPTTYHYRSRFTADVLSGMSDLTNSVETFIGSLNGRTVLDIGCNDGSLLDNFSKKGSTTIGVEPTGAYADAEGRSHNIIHDFFNESTAKKILKKHPSVDIITFTNVFAHIENLPEMLKALLRLMNENTVLVVENHYLGAVLEKNQFDTFYHEHPRTYSLNSFVHIARELGREVISIEFPKRYGGNIRIMIGKSRTVEPVSTSFIQQTLQQEKTFYESFFHMRLFIASWRKKKRKQINELVQKYGKLNAKAFPGRAAILVSLLGLSENEIACVYEKPGSLKIGHYVPGTRIPIKSDEELIPCLLNTAILVNLAWHINREIDAYLRSVGFTGQIINIID